MSKIVADNTSIYIHKCKDYGVKYLKELVYKHKVINNIPLTKTQLSKLNKKGLYELIDKYNIDIDKYQNKHIIQFKYEFMFDMKYMDYGNNIHKPYKYRKLVNYFRFVDF